MRGLKKSIFIFSAVVLVVLILPERITMPVVGATKSDWNRDSFWYEPWGTSGVHHGIDIFGKRGTPVVSSVDGIVLYTGHVAKGGNVVLMLGPKWRLHYYAHLDSISATTPGRLARARVSAAWVIPATPKASPRICTMPLSACCPSPGQSIPRRRVIKKRFFWILGNISREQTRSPLSRH